MHPVPEFATVDPWHGMTAEKPGPVQNLAGGRWFGDARLREDIPDPLNCGPFLSVPDTSEHAPFIAGLKSCGKSGLHNPRRRPERYVMLGRVCARAAATLAQPAVEDYFTRLIQRVMPKSWPRPSMRSKPRAAKRKPGRAT